VSFLVTQPGTSWAPLSIAGSFTLPSLRALQRLVLTLVLRRGGFPSAIDASSFARICRGELGYPGTFSSRKVSELIREFSPSDIDVWPWEEVINRRTDLH